MPPVPVLPKRLLCLGRPGAIRRCVRCRIAVPGEPGLDQPPAGGEIAIVRWQGPDAVQVIGQQQSRPTRHPERREAAPRMIVGGWLRWRGRDMKAPPARRIAVDWTRPEMSGPIGRSATVDCGQDGPPGTSGIIHAAPSPGYGGVERPRHPMAGRHMEDPTHMEMRNDDHAHQPTQ